MKARSLSGATRVLTLAALGCIISQFLAGSVALSQPFPSFILDTTRVRGPALGYATGTRTVFGGNVGLIVWGDSPDLLGARVDLSGTLLDSLPIDIGGPDFPVNYNARPQVAWSGRNFMVVWTSSNREVFALVAPDGQVTQRTILQDSNVEFYSGAVDFDGSNFLASWISRSAESPLKAVFTRITFGGVVLDSPPKRVAPGSSDQQYAITVSFYDDRYLAVWTDYERSYELWGTFILRDGSVTDPIGFPIRSGVATGYPEATHDRHNFIVSWIEASRMAKLARVTDDGDVLDTSGTLIDSFSRGTSDVLSTRDTTLVVFCRDSLWNGTGVSVLAVRLDTALRRLDSVPVVIDPRSPESSYPSVALCGNDYLVAWSKTFCIDSVPYNINAVFRRLARDGQVVDSAAVIASCGINSHSYPDVASDGTNFLAVWIDTRHDSIQRSEAVCGMRFSQDGTRLDPRGFRISSRGAAHPALAYGAGCYLVCWSHNRDIYGARVFPDGRLADSLPIAIEHDAGTASYPDVAFGESLFLVVWRRSGAIYGVRVTADGAVADSAPRLMQAGITNDSRYPQVGFDGQNFLVARNERANPHEFRAVRVSTAGDVLDPADIVFGPARSSTSTPRVAFGDSVYMVVDSRGYSAWRISPQGVALDSTINAIASGPSVVFDGTNFMLVSRGDSTNELRGLRIAPDGKVLDTLPFLLTVTDGAAVSRYRHAAVTNNSGKVGLVFGATEPAPYLAGRIRAMAFPAVGISSGREDVRVAPFRALPNPASRMVNLSFGLKQAGLVQVSAFDASGRRCAVIHSGGMPAGGHTLPFDTRRLANGVYFLRFEAGADRRSSRLVVSH